MKAREIYSDRLMAEGLIDAEYLADEVKKFEEFLDKEFEDAKNLEAQKADWLRGDWEGLGLPDDDERRGKTGVSTERLQRIGAALTTIPDGITAHKTLARVIKGRETAYSTGKGLDWAAGEHLAYATLLDEGYPIRLSGQDCGRGTFSQRHSHIVDQNTGDRYTPLNNFNDKAAHYEVIDSLLSEEAVLGFEYGYSLADPNTLTLWEAQFGDFSNGAQVLFQALSANGCVCLAS